MAKIRIEINGVSQDVTEGTTLESYAESKGLAGQKGVAVAINGKVVRRRDWSTAIFADGDKIMLLTAAQGG